MTKLQSLLSCFFTVISIFALFCSNAVGKYLIKEGEGVYPYVDAESMVSSFNIRATVAKNGNIFTYDYTLSNPATSTGMIQLVYMDIHKPKGSVELSKEGLVNGPCLKSEEVFTVDRDVLSLQELKDDFPVMPVGVTAPPPWHCGYRMDSLTPWLHASPITILLSWAIWDNKEDYLSPRQSLGGFQLMSRGLPGIRGFHAEPFIDPYELDFMLEESGIVYDLGPPTKGAHGRTIAPTAPPAKFDSLAFIKIIQEYLAESQKLKWLKDATFVAKLKGHLDKAVKSISAKNIETAKDAMKAFIVTLPIPPAATKTCTSECSGLLVFNAQYLLDQLSVKPIPKGNK